MGILSKLNSFLKSVTNNTTFIDLREGNPLKFLNPLCIILAVKLVFIAKVDKLENWPNDFSKNPLKGL